MRTEENTTRWKDPPWARLLFTATILLLGAFIAWPMAVIQDRVLPKDKESTHTVGSISLLNKPWGVILDLPGFTVKISETKPDGRRYFFAINETTGVNVSVTLEQTDSTKPTRDCRREFTNRLKDKTFKKNDARIWESGDKTFFEYTVPNFSLPGEVVRHIDQRNQFVCLVRDDVFVDMHLSKVQYSPEDEKLFSPIVDSFSFSENIQRSSMDYLAAGSVFYLKHDYARAIPLYDQAFSLEKRDRQLTKVLWYVLLDNLGMAYGMTGDLEKARQTFEYGIQQDPEYPLFYYNMACYYGEMGDAANAGEYLKKAYEHKANVIPGEGGIPDPHKDDSFKKVMKNQDFRRLVDSLVKGN
jgi:hypothetical protein